MDRFFTTALLVTCLLAPAGSLTSHAQERPAESSPPSRAGKVPPASDYESALTAILEQIVTEDGMVRYGLLSESLRCDFRRVLKAVEEFDPRSAASDREKLAFWMNAYNVQMLQNVLENPTVEHIVDEGYAAAFFTTPLRVAGTGISLDQIEHVILRGEEGPRRLTALRLESLDPRIHVGINCAAVSCPTLRRRAFSAANVNEELERAMRDFVGRDRHIRMDGSTMVLSSILDWFGADFEKTGLPLGDYLVSYLHRDREDYAVILSRLSGRSAKELRQDPRVRFEYDWTVNRAASAH